MNKHLWVFLFIAATVLLLTACQAKNEGAQPPEIRYGQDICDSCGMQIDEARFAAATLLNKGEYRRFDDIHEMIVYHMDHPEEQVQVWFVHDYKSEEWIDGQDATFVRSQAIMTPMGGGIVAFADQAEAEAFAAEMKGELFKLDPLRAQIHLEVHE